MFGYVQESDSNVHTNALNEQPFVTELDLKVALLPVSAVEYLRDAMPKVKSETSSDAFDYEAWLDTIFG